MESESREPIPTTSSTPFYVTGGTLRGDAASYVRRQADEALFASLMAGEFCYVLDARQMGKSSLMIRTAARLEAEGITVIKLDLTAVGLDLSSEQWYFGLLEGLGCRLETELETYWEAHRQLGPLKRWFKAIEEVLLPRTPGRVVIFVDEIDIVRSLPFRTDEFFAGIRECYNRRASDVELNRLAFCLLGVTTPSELIDDVAMTPFNIGTRIELNDFTPHEAALLGRGLSGMGRNGAELLKRVLYWTGGHPYLTQQLCRSVAEVEEVQSPDDVDRSCADLFLSPRARKQDNNLLFVRARLLQSGTDVAGLLELYGQVVANKRVADEDRDPRVDQLRLSGIVRVISGCLRVRNRIYFLVFDQEWVRTNMPGGEVRRQRTAYRRGLVRALALSSAVLAAVIAFAAYGFNQAHLARINAGRADDNSRKNGELARKLKLALETALSNKNVADGKTLEARQNLALAENRLLDANRAHIAEVSAEKGALSSAAMARKSAMLANKSAALARSNARLANKRADEFVHLLYAADMNLIPNNYPNDIARVRELLDETASGKYRGFEWGYWNRLCHLDGMTLTGHTDRVVAAAFSPDSKRVVTGSCDRTAKVWDVESGQLVLTLTGHTDPVYSVAFSPDGKRIVTGSHDHTARVWDALTGRQMLTLKGHQHEVWSVAFAPDGKRIVTGGMDHTARIWDARSGREVFNFRGHKGIVTAATYSPDSKRIATASFDRTARVWDAQTGREILTLTGHRDIVGSVAFSRDGKRIVTGSADHTVKIWNAANGRELLTLKGHLSIVQSAAFSPDGKRIVAGSWDGTARVWDAETGREVLTLKGHTGAIETAAFSPDGKRIVTASWDKTAKVWESASEQPLYSRKGIKSTSGTADWELFVCSYGTNEVLCYDGETHRFLGAFAAKDLRDPQGLTFGPDGNLYVTSTTNHILRFDGRTGAYLGVFARGGGLSDPIDLTFGPGGDLYVLNSDRQEVLRFNGKSGAFKSVFVPARSGAITYGRAVKFGPDGSLYVCSTNTNQILRYSGATGAFLNVFASGNMQDPQRIVFRPDGYLYVASASGVVRYRADTGKFVDTLVSGGLVNCPVGLVFPVDGNMYVSGWISGNIVGYQARDGRYLEEVVPAGRNGLARANGLAWRLAPARQPDVRSEPEEMRPSPSRVEMARSHGMNRADGVKNRKPTAWVRKIRN